MINIINIDLFIKPEEFYIFIGILGSLASIVQLFAIFKNKFRKIDLLRRQTLDQNRFVNRKQEIKGILELVSDPSKIVINVFGDKGVGKSAVLRLFTDIINKKVERDYRKMFPRKKTYKSLKNYCCLYYDISDRTGIEDIKKDLCKKSFPNQKPSFENYIFLINKIFEKSDLIIILDNFNNPALYTEMGRLIDYFSTFMPRIKYIIGSIDQLVIYSQLVYEIEILPLEETEIETYANQRGHRLSKNQLQDLISISNGLPIFLEIVLNSSIDMLNNKILLMNIRTFIFQEVWGHLTAEAIEVLKIASFLNLTNTEVSENILKDMDLQNINEAIVILKKNSLIIPFTFGQIKFKVHDQIRDIVIDKYFAKATDINKRIFLYYKKYGKNKEATLHLILSNELIHHLDFIFDVIKDEIKNENLPFLIAVGQLFERFQRSNYIINNSTNLYNLILYSYLYATMGIGNYIGAAKIVENVVIGSQGISGIKNINSEIEFEFHFLMADLDHLQNKYAQSIEMYRQLADIASERKYYYLLPKCAWGIAHSYRHQGKYLTNAVEYYNECLKEAKVQNDYKYYIKAVNGIIGVFLVRNNFEYPFNEEFSKIYQLNGKGGNIDEVILSTMKYHSIYLRKIKNLPDAKYYIDKSFEGFKSIGKRLIYNLHFEYAEYYRDIEDFDSSFKHYLIAYNFSEKNNDRNLKTHSLLGIILCEIGINNYYYSGSKEEQIKNVLRIENIADEADIHITKLQARIVLEYLQENRQLELNGFNSDFARYLEILNLCQETFIYKNLSRDTIKHMHLILL
jgi:hypothetical protein